ncbi:MAG TPA: ribosome biogenesis GTP-binding protein YihA/YsxC [Longimicrobiales bacterium]|nr:ribosome biogenesis GTP-binding protein YihA/YsxC [Longimicrobiales bacterium]
MPTIAFAGRSNVGKSSLINRLLGRTRTAIARVSNRPGKTQEINFYRVRARTDADEPSGPSGVDFEFYLADLPGYGFARVPGALRGRWKPLVEGYLGDPALRGVIQLLDSRHAATVEDVEMLRYLSDHGVPTMVALTKVDKLKGNARRKEMASRLQEITLPEEQVILVSATTGEGCDDLLSSMEELLLAAKSDSDS